MLGSLLQTIKGQNRQLNKAGGLWYNLVGEEDREGGNVAMQTSIANTLDFAGDEALLDRQAKKIFSHEAVLASATSIVIKSPWSGLLLRFG